ncbi:MAG: AI-2E family transporter [Firmicutes bacterium]|nr:AI-2E family transporter [Bacillota bacterium]
MDFNDKKNVKNLMLIVFGAILFYLGVKNITVVASAAGWLFGVISPFVLGAVIAFIVNVPMSRIEYHLFEKRGSKMKGQRGISFIVTLALVIAALVVVVYIVVPQLADTIKMIAVQLPGAFEAAKDWMLTKMSYWDDLRVLLEKITIDWDEIIKKVSAVLQDAAGAMVDSGIGAVTNIVGAIVNFFIGFVFAIYILLAKEKLGGQGKQILYALLSEKQADKVLEICSISYRVFSKFLSGQCLEACILGALFVVTMTIFRLPYAMLIGVLIGFCALIPIVGAFIGCGVGIFLILMVSPVKALIFLVLFLVLQQLEGNLIYPKVVGNSVGLPSIWVLAAVTIGGNLMGVVGMLVFIPLCSVCYILFRMYVKGKLEEKQIPAEKYLP